jgi:hypothetical protein
VSADTPKSSRYTLITPIKKEQACLHQATKGAKPALLSSVSESAESQVSSFPGDAVAFPVPFAGLVVEFEDSYK